MKRRIFSLIIFTSLIFFGLNADEEAQKSEIKRKRFRVVGYLPEYRLGNIQDSWGKNLTDIVYFSIKPTAAGDLDTSKLKKDSLIKIRKLTKKNNQRLLICLGGWGKSVEFAKMATKKESRKKFIDNLLKFCRQYELDGADYDWEFPKDKKEKKAYSELLAETKKAFKPADMIVTVAVGSMKQLSPEAYKAVDFVHLMSYDHGKKHSTYEHGVSDTKRHLAFGVPKEKLCLGLPFYGRNLKKWGDTRTYFEIMEQLKPNPDEDEKGGIYFNGISTIKKKTRYAIKNGLAGIMIWEIGQDTNDDTSLLKAINLAILESEKKDIFKK